MKKGVPSEAKDGTKLIEGVVVFEGFIYTLVAKVRRLHVVPFTMHKRAVK